MDNINFNEDIEKSRIKKLTITFIILCIVLVFFVIIFLLILLNSLFLVKTPISGINVTSSINPSNLKLELSSVQLSQGNKTVYISIIKTGEGNLNDLKVLFFDSFGRQFNYSINSLDLVFPLSIDNDKIPGLNFSKIKLVLLSYSYDNKTELSSGIAPTIINPTPTQRSSNSSSGSSGGGSSGGGGNPTPCTPNCDGKQCGDNGCSGSCGTCFDNQTCNSNGTCINILKINFDISIATIKDIFNYSDLINITDPPDKKEPNLNSIKNNGVISSNSYRFKEGEVIVKFKENVIANRNNFGVSSVMTNSDRINQLISKYNVRNIEKLYSNNANSNIKSLGIQSQDPHIENSFILYVDEPLELIKELKNDPNIEYVEPNYLYNVSFIPSDQLYYKQWAHKNTQAELGWDIEKGNSSVIIAIIDTGVDWTHEDLKDNIWNNTDEIFNNGIDDDSNGYIDDVRGWDFTNTTRNYYCSLDCLNEDNNPMDEYGHGTHCAGIAAAVTNNIGIIGVCPNCKIMALRDAGLESANIARAIKYATDNGAKVISMSFGGSDFSQTIQDMVNYAHDRGVILVAAAGNSNTNSIEYPGGYDNVISVTATDINDKKASFSNYGSWTDIAAPGVNITSTILKIGMLNDSSGYISLSGTSMATPYVAGLVGLLLSKNNSYNYDQIKEILSESSNFINETDKYIGVGRVNVYNALTKKPASGITSKIFYPSDMEIVMNDININGTVSGGNFKLEIGEGVYPLNWTVLKTGSNSVINKSIYLLNTQSFEDKTYTLRLSVTNNDNSLTDYKRIRFLKNIIKGFPVKLNGSYVFDNSPVVADINNDGKKEILVTKTKGWVFLIVFIITEQTVDIYNSSGQIINRIMLDNKFINTPSIGNLDQSGDSEIVVSDFRGNIKVYDSNGNTKSIINLSKWMLIDEKNQNNNVIYPPLLSDINGDSKLEIVVVGNDDEYLSNGQVNPNQKGHLFAFYYNGTIMPGWPIDIFTTTSNIASADMNNDTINDIILGTIYEKSYEPDILKILVFNYSGKNISSYNDSRYFSDSGKIIGISDFNKDGNNDISYLNSNQLYHIRNNGNPKILDSLSDSLHFWEWIDEYTIPIISDLDSNGYSEDILLNSAVFSSDRISVINWNGNNFLNFPLNNSNLEGWAPYSPTLSADINNDGFSEIISATDGGKIYAFDKDKNIIPGWPKIFGDTIRSISVDDINNDKSLDLIVLTSYNNELFIYSLDLKTNFSKNLLNWPMYGQNTGHTFYFNNSLPSLCGNNNLDYPEECEYNFNGNISEFCRDNCYYQDCKKVEDCGTNIDYPEYTCSNNLIKQKKKKYTCMFSNKCSVNYVYETYYDCRNFNQLASIPLVENDMDFIYLYDFYNKTAFGDKTGRIIKLKKSDFSVDFIQEIPYTDIKEMIVDESRMYLVSRINNRISIINKTNLNLIGTIDKDENGTKLYPQGVSIDNDYIYVGQSASRSSDPNSIVLFNKSDLSFIQRKIIEPGKFPVWIIRVDNGYIYGVDGSYRLEKRNLSNFSIMLNTTKDVVYINDIDVDDENLYYGGDFFDSIYVANKSNLSLIQKIEFYGYYRFGDIISFSVDSNYVYVSDDKNYGSNRRLLIINKTNTTDYREIKQLGNIMSCHEGYDECVSVYNRPQSKIVNNENISISGNLKLVILKNISGTWNEVRVVTDRDVTIPANGLLKLDIGKDNEGNQVFEGWNSNLITITEEGGYSVSTIFNSSGTVKQSTWQFSVVSSGGELPTLQISLRILRELIEFVKNLINNWINIIMILLILIELVLIIIYLKLNRRNRFIKKLKRKTKN